MLCGCSSESASVSVSTAVPSASAAVKEKQTVNLMTPVMDEDGNAVSPLNSYVKLMVYGGPVQKMADTAEDVLLEYHKLADSDHFYLDDYGERIHNAAWISAQPMEEELSVSKEMAEMLAASLQYADVSNGWFSPVVGSVSDVWKGKFAVPGGLEEDPDAEEIQSALACSAADASPDALLSVDTEKDTVVLHAPDGCMDRVKINLGAMAKGYIVDRMYEALLVYDCPFLIDAGSSSIRFYSDDPDVTWKVGVRTPDSGELLYVLQGSTGAIATSGDDQQFCFVETEEGMIRRHHILNPFTGYPENHYRSITLYSDGEAGVLDAMSTALFSMKDAEKEKEILSMAESDAHAKISGSWLCEEEDGFVLYVTENMTEVMMEGSLKDGIKEVVQDE